MDIIRLLCSSAALLLASHALPVTAQDVKAGQRIAQQGAQGVAACASCHGGNGEGNPSAGFPRIAGLPARYFVHQMQSFASGQRHNQVMSPIATSISDKDAHALAQYYAALDAPPAKQAGGQQAKPGQQGRKPVAAQMKRASQLANVGDESRRLQACANCHGPNGAGEPPVMPPLAGQHESYLLAALKEWKSGSRKTDPSGQMPAIASRLDDADMAALAAWYASQPVPPPAASRVVRSEVAGPARAQPAAGRGGGRPSTPGTGSEQGSGVTGGSQGPGGSAGSTGAAQRTK